MTEFRLKNRERVDLENFMLHTPSVKECCRAQAIHWLDEGESVEQIAELLHVSRQTVYNWVDRSKPPRHTSTLLKRIVSEVRG